MSATYTQTSVRSQRSAEKMLSVVGIYHDPDSREQLLAIAQRLATRFKSDLQFDFHWWRTVFLNDPTLALRARSEAASADIVLIGCGQAENFSFSLLNWFEDWISERTLPDGVLLYLPPNDTPSTAAALHTWFYFQDIAQRARMDYLTGTTKYISHDSAMNFNPTSLNPAKLGELAAAKQYEPPPPSHFGLNE